MVTLRATLPTPFGPMMPILPPSPLLVKSVIVMLSAGGVSQKPLRAPHCCVPGRVVVVGDRGRLIDVESQPRARVGDVADRAVLLEAPRESVVAVELVEHEIVDRVPRVVGRRRWLRALRARVVDGEVVRAAEDRGVQQAGVVRLHEQRRAATVGPRVEGQILDDRVVDVDTDQPLVGLFLDQPRLGAACALQSDRRRSRDHDRSTASRPRRARRRTCPRARTPRRPHRLQRPEWRRRRRWCCRSGRLPARHTR